MLFISPSIGAYTATAPKDAEAGEEDNSADSDNDGEESESLFVGMFSSGHLPLPAVYLIMPAIRRRHP